MPRLAKSHATKGRWLCACGVDSGLYLGAVRRSQKGFEQARDVSGTGLHKGPLGCCVWISLDGGKGVRRPLLWSKQTSRPANQEGLGPSDGGTGGDSCGQI